MVADARGHSWRGARGDTTRNAFSKAALYEPGFVLKSGVLQRLLTRQMHFRTESRRKMGNGTCIKPPANGVAVVGISGWVTAAQSLITASDSPRRIHWHSMCQSDQWWCRLAARFPVLTPRHAPGELTRDPYADMSYRGHGEKMLGARSRNVYPGYRRSIKAVYQPIIRGTYTPAAGQRVWPDSKSLTSSQASPLYR